MKVEIDLLGKAIECLEVNLAHLQESLATARYAHKQILAAANDMAPGLDTLLFNHTSTETDPARKAFEVHVLNSNGTRVCLERDEHGNYKSDDVQRAWNGCINTPKDLPQLVWQNAPDTFEDSGRLIRVRPASYGFEQTYNDAISRGPERITSTEQSQA